MKPSLIILTAFLSMSVLNGCSHYSERKAPCPATASLSKNPCNPLPINVAHLPTLNPRPFQIMKYIIIASACTLMLSGCMRYEKNPLSEHDPKIIAAYLYENTGPAIWNCAKVWANPKAANATVIKNCEEKAFYVAEKLSDNGYGEISSNNIKVPAIWQEFKRIGEEREERANQRPSSAGMLTSKVKNR